MPNDFFANRVTARTTPTGSNPLQHRQLRIDDQSNSKVALLTVERVEWMTPDMLRRIADAVRREADRMELRARRDTGDSMPQWATQAQANN